MSISRCSAFPKTRLHGTSLRKHLAAAALAATVGMASTAHAIVVTFNTPIVVPNTVDGVYVNLLTGATGTSAGTTGGWDFNPYNSGSALSFFFNTSPPASNGGVGGTTTGPYLDLAPGTTVSSASVFTAVTPSAQTAAFQVVGTHRLGVRFFNDATATINYGAVTLTSGGANGFPLTITSWSFENTGGPYTLPELFANGFE
jgi:hypothetical protein